MVKRLVSTGLGLAVVVLAGACGTDGKPRERATATRPAGDTMPSSRAGAELVGTPAKPFANDLVWMNTDPMSLEQLRGQVVLVRFWTDKCPFCEASAPGLSALHERYADDGLVVLGLFHSKPRGAERDAAAIKTRAGQLGMDFPIASDARWDTLERWWLTTGEGERAATSVSFLIDANGVIRWVHPGPEFHPGGPSDAEHDLCRQDYEDAVRAIELLLGERNGETKSV